MTDENKQIMRRIYDEIINEGNLDVVDEVIAEDLIEHEELQASSPAVRASGPSSRCSGRRSLTCR